MTETTFVIEEQTGKRHSCFTAQEVAETCKWLNRRGIVFSTRTAKELKTMFADRNHEVDLMRYLTADVFQLAATTASGVKLTEEQSGDLGRTINFLALILQQGDIDTTLQDCVRYMRSIQSESFRHNSILAS